MDNENNIFSRLLCLAMNEDNSEERKHSYEVFKEQTKTGNPSFDAYIDVLVGVMHEYGAINPYQGKSCLTSFITKADAFLQRHASLTYETFLKQAKPEEFTTDDYGILPDKKRLKIRAFEHRTLLHLCALEECEQQGLNLEEILQQIRTHNIPSLKHEPEEPSFNEILKVLGKL